MRDEQRDVLQAVRCFAHDRTLASSPQSTGWVEEAQQQGVLSVCADVLSRSGLPLGGLLSRARLLGAAAQLRTAADLGPLAQALDEEGIRWVVVKGPVLAAVYREANVRSYSDLDVLVHPMDLPTVLDLLEAHGATLLDQNWELIAASGRAEISWRLPHGTLLDLHWHLVNEAVIRQQLGQRPTQILEDRRPMELGTVTAWSLAPVDVVVHTAQHACLSGGHMSKWLLDVHQALRWAQPDPAILRKAARAARLELVLAVILDRTSRYIDNDMDRWRRSLTAGGTYRRGAAALSRAYPPTAARDTFSGRAIFSSTRYGTAASVRALSTQLSRNARQGPGRRTVSVSTAPLRQARGGAKDKQAWLALAAAHG